MPDAVERIMNLAFAFTNARGPLTAEQIRDEVGGYPMDQDEAAFLRMFERDKEDLRRSGFTIDFDEQQQSYTLDRASTFAAPVDLTAEEAAAIRIAGSALLDDPSFPFADDLRLALAKLAAGAAPDDDPAPTRLADEDSDRQGALTALLADAAARMKTTRFLYTNARGAVADHEVEPYGLFLHDGRWYLVARDTALDDVRTYTVGRIADVVVNDSAPRTPDFSRPTGFDVAGFIRLPFQYGSDEGFTATLRFDADEAWRAPGLTSGHGTLTPEHGDLIWRVNARSAGRLLRFVIESGPGLTIVEPPDLIDRLRSGLAEVEVLHG